MFPNKAVINYVWYGRVLTGAKIANTRFGTLEAYYDEIKQYCVNLDSIIYL